MSKFILTVTSTAQLSGEWYNNHYVRTHMLNDGTGVYEYVSNEVHSYGLGGALDYAKAFISDLPEANSILSVKINKIA